MMALSADSRQQGIIEEARAFADREIRPNAAKFDERQALPRDLIAKLAERGFLAATFPKKYGGLELDPVYYGLFTEEIGKACCSTRSLITVQTSLVGETLLRWGTELQKEMWLPLVAAGKKIGAFALSEPETGSDAKNIRTGYSQKGDRYVISGRKKWISFGEIADFYMVIATSGREVSAFLVERDREGVNPTPIKGMLGGRASHIASIEFKDVEVPKENMLGQPGSGFTYIVNTALDQGRYSIAWAGVAVAQEALEAMVGYARHRVQFGKKICNHQLIQGMIADAVTKVHAARALCLRAGELRKAGDSSSITETTIAKYFSSKAALEVATDAVQVHGAKGCQSGSTVERLFREAKLLEIIEGTSQIQQVLISGFGLRKYFVRRVTEGD